MQIRGFRLGDEADLFRVFYSAIHGTAIHDYSIEQVNAWAPSDIDADTWARRMRDLQPFIAEIDNEVVGYADVQSSGYIDHFFVSPAYSRRGVGTQLITRVHEQAKHLGLTELTADVSKTAEPFFARHGFDVLERRFPVRLGVTLENALMRKAL